MMPSPRCKRSKITESCTKGYTPRRHCANPLISESPVVLRGKVSVRDVHDVDHGEQGDAGGNFKTPVEWPVLFTCHSNPEKPPYACQTATRHVGRVPVRCGYCCGPSPNPAERGQSVGDQHSKPVFKTPSMSLDLHLSTLSPSTTRSSTRGGF